MKIGINLLRIVLSAAAATLLTQCNAFQFVSSLRGGAHPVKVERIGDCLVTTRLMINRPLTIKDCGKVYEEVIITSKRGTSVQKRVIVHFRPKLELNNVTVKKFDAAN